ncbi:MAG: alpha-glucosidase C-terminal domain-containing protein [Calditrichia bacterium]|nr:alpha-glucosidase C-terminal domain-containing protein [Calditrichia bacterium]
MSKNKFSAKKFHYLEPDYSRPVLELDKKLEERIRDKLKFLYGDESADKLYDELFRLLKVYYAHKTSEMIEWEKDFDEKNRFTEKDVILITYGDLISGKNQKPLVTLEILCKTYLKGVFNTLHILPFFPYSSDRGFAVMDFEEVDPHLGSWDDILNLRGDFRLMFDGVFNHVSSKSSWFQEFLNQNPYYQNFFTVFSTKEKISPDHLKLIVRPRTSDVLTEFRTLNGTRLVWTTFSPDQIDLNFKNPEVLLKMVEILLTYVRRGADIIRLDAVTYLWEELGTSCVHLDQSHVSIKLFRDVLDAVAPHVALITETNVPHKENIRYFGNGHDEAQMVYNFALPPLVLYTFQTGNSRKLTEWAASLERISDTATYFNFLDSHDGIGVMAVKNILTPEEIEIMALRIVEHGGFISYKAEGDGNEVPYELNITWYSALNRDDSDESRELKIKRYLASRSIALVVMGVPGIYFHGLLGSKNDADAVLEEGHTRSINRKTIRKKELLAEMDNKNSNIYQVASGLIRLIHYRIREKCFHPDAPQTILSLSDKVFSVLRTSTEGQEIIMAIINITNDRESLSIDLRMHGLKGQQWIDVLTKKTYKANGDNLELNLDPYDILWLKEKSH